MHHFQMTCTNVRFTASVFVLLFTASVQAGAMDLKGAVVVSPPGLSGPEQKAVKMLVEEVEKRTRVRWPEMNAWPSSNAPVLVVGNRPALEQLAGPFAKELES